MKLNLLAIFCSSLFAFSCNQNKIDSIENKATRSSPTTNPKEYWYGGEAEISSYQLQQARYGEIHEGKAVLVYVTEPFSRKKNTKANYASAEDISTLKLNFNKKFTTGIYPYSMMNSTFFPFENGLHSLKISTSIQEWCGHNYMELKNKEKFEVSLASYFEDESFNIQLDKVALEDDIWSKIRLNPNELFVGETQMIPSFFYLNLKHKKTKAYTCNITKKTKDSSILYSLEYPQLGRKMTLVFDKKFPHKITSWTETYDQLTTSAQLIKTIKSAYWNKNSTTDKTLRKTLGLDN